MTIIVLLNFLFVSINSHAIDPDCCSKIVETKTCCDEINMPSTKMSCSMENETSAITFNNCGCIHDNPIESDFIIIKDNLKINLESLKKED